MNTRLFVIFAAFSLQMLVSHAYVPLFIRGRPVGGLLGAPKVPKHVAENLVLPGDKWFEQRLDHFKSSDLRTWNQRYFVNDTFFNRKGNGPVFLMIGGEGAASPVWVVVGSMMKYAAEYGALCFLLEHRFYGKSHPTRLRTTHIIIHAIFRDTELGKTLHPIWPTGSLCRARGI